MANKRDTLIGYFSRGARPTGSQFEELINSLLLIENDGAVHVPEGRTLDVKAPVKYSGPHSGTILYGRTNASGIPDGDGFRIRYQEDFFKGNRQGDALVFEKTDANELKPDGGIVFTNHGIDEAGKTEETVSLAIKGTGNIGVGTADPAYKLDVAGNLNISGELYKNGKPFSMSPWQSGGGNLSYKDGHVGIGTNAPASKLHVQGGGEYSVDLLINGRMQSGDDKNRGGIWMGSKRNLFVGQADSDDKIGFWAKGWRFVVNTVGNAGIGTATPAEKLHVEGSVRGNVKGALRISTGHGYVDVGPQNEGWSHFVTDRGRFYFNKGISVNQGIVGSYDKNDLQLQTGNTTRIVVKNDSGRVGIGTTAPEAKLDVSGSIKFHSGAEQLYWGSKHVGEKDHRSFLAPRKPDGSGWDWGQEFGYHNHYRAWYFDGNVGIGTPAPAAKLDVQGALRANYIDVDPQNAAHEGGEIRLRGSAKNNPWHIDNYQGIFRLHHSGAAHFHVNKLGNVGIGIASSTHKLNVAGDINFTGNLLKNGKPFSTAPAASPSPWKATGKTVSYTGKVDIVAGAGAYPHNKALRIVANGNSPSFKDHVLIESTAAKGYGIAFAGAGHHRGGIYAENAGGAKSTLGKLTLWARGNGNIILNGGNVGLGTAGPGAKLHVHGKGKANIDVLVNGRIQLGDAANRGGIWMGNKRTFFVGQGDSVDKVGFWARHKGWQFILNSAGNVGIGTTTPSAKLDVQGTVRANYIDVDAQNTTHEGGEIRLRGSAKNNHWHIDNYKGGFRLHHSRKVFLNINKAGNTGIGTTNPKQKLHLYSSGVTTLRLQSAKGFGPTAIEFWSDPQGSKNEWRPAYIKSTDNKVGTFTGGLAFYTNGVGHARRVSGIETMRLVNGCVGIGTADPGKDKLDVRGRCFSQGGWHVRNADYAEYFESESGKAIPAGIAVAVGKNGTVRPAKKGETPIGIVSAKPGVIGNSPKEWPGKYLRDELGHVIMEEYEEYEMVPKVRKKRKKKTDDDTAVEEPLEEIVLDENGEPVMVKSRKKIKGRREKLNPDYDESKEYIIREDRDEWCCVGLLGQLPLRKGQPVAPNWVKLHEISDAADLWLVK